MTFQELNNKYQAFKNKYNGKYTDYDGYYGAQCWDLAQRYFVEYLGVPEWVLSGSGLVSNMLDRDREELNQYFDEISIYEMNPGDVCIWEYGHIAIFDSWDGNQNWYFSQNPNPCQVMPINREGLHAFRLKGVYQPEPPKVEESVTENDEITKLKKTIEEKDNLLKVQQTQLKQQEEEILQLTEENSKLKNDNALFRKENEELLTKNVDLKKDNDNLKNKISNQAQLIYKSPKTDYYAIKLEENQELYLK